MAKMSYTAQAEQTQLSNEAKPTEPWNRSGLFLHCLQSTSWALGSRGAHLEAGPKGLEPSELLGPTRNEEIGKSFSGKMAMTWKGRIDQVWTSTNTFSRDGKRNVAPVVPLRAVPHGSRHLLTSLLRSDRGGQRWHRGGEQPPFQPNRMTLASHDSFSLYGSWYGS